MGSNKALKVNLRFIAATNKDLEVAVVDGGFREDLYYRINTISLKIPPLRERKEDIPLLANNFLYKYSMEFQKNVVGITDEALDRMVKYRWPGNVRELQNVIERALLITESNKITPDNLPESIRPDQSFQKGSINGQLSIEDYTKAFIVEYQSQYNEQQLAAKLGITRKSLWEKRKKWGIDKS